MRRQSGRHGDAGQVSTSTSSPANDTVRANRPEQRPLQPSSDSAQPDRPLVSARRAGAGGRRHLGCRSTISTAMRCLCSRRCRSFSACFYGGRGPGSRRLQSSRPRSSAQTLLPAPRIEEGHNVFIVDGRGGALAAGIAGRRLPSDGRRIRRALSAGTPLRSTRVRLLAQRRLARSRLCILRRCRLRPPALFATRHRHRLRRSGLAAPRLCQRGEIQLDRNQRPSAQHSRALVDGAASLAVHHAVFRHGSLSRRLRRQPAVLERHGSLGRRGGELCRVAPRRILVPADRERRRRAPHFRCFDRCSACDQPRADHRGTVAPAGAAGAGADLCRCGAAIAGSLAKTAIGAAVHIHRAVAAGRAVERRELHRRHTAIRGRRRRPGL